MADQIIYDIVGQFECIARSNADGSQTSFGPGSSLWDDYCAKNGVPPATGTPTFKPARVPLAYTATYNYIKPNGTGGLTQAQQLQIALAVCSKVLVDNPQLAAALNTLLNLQIPFDQANP